MPKLTDEQIAELEAEAKDAELTVLKVAADLWARIDAAEVLIRQAMEGWHSLHSAYLPAIDTCPHCSPYREWLAGDKEDGSE